MSNDRAPDVFRFTPCQQNGAWLVWDSIAHKAVARAKDEAHAMSLIVDILARQERLFMKNEAG